MSISLMENKKKRNKKNLQEASSQLRMYLQNAKS